ncbi:glutamate 5-kinase [Trichophyton tonsurans CBS 112818]|uniref:Glutamate 5-kinase n=1 Tax=Trichophyton tonsurans (strain CBS 112818) TaxID=647933 RepID=F2RTQ7_TRIT1|nr:glutamate 5-kinase [Trichophyton tonsurans CBS 112818]
MAGSKSLKVVIKLGTSSIVDEKSHEPILSNLTLIVEAAVKLRKDGHDVIIVSSGAVGVGMRRMDVAERPKHLPSIQALAAVGQCQLMSTWDSLFSHLRQPIAQILITRNDIVDRTQYVNAQNTLAQLLSMGVIPIVNENDTLTVSEIKFGDNDTLSAITAAMIEADYLFLMTDVDGLYTANPRTNPDARVIDIVQDISSLEADVSSAGSSLGTGGMGSKIVAARLATSAGVTTVITRSSRPGTIEEIIEHHSSNDATSSDSALGVEETKPDPPLHTCFLPSDSPVHSRSFWLLHGLKPHGSVYIDEEAYNTIRDTGYLLPSGVIAVEGKFGYMEAIKVMVAPRPSQNELNDDYLMACSTPKEAKEVGRGLINYGYAELSRIKGLRSTQIHSVLGYSGSEYAVSRENLAFFEMPSRCMTPTSLSSPAPETNNDKNPLNDIPAASANQ